MYISTLALLISHPVRSLTNSTIFTHFLEQKLGPFEGLHPNFVFIRKFHKYFEFVLKSLKGFEINKATQKYLLFCLFTHLFG
ncbi:MAG: hypothetical protein A2910_02265 [Candidatus Yanofskybacteria bacterium RIFCSPLOWO2_01_FULL_39_28]|nr:MAG: hypothetical protein A2910_02265 [Candidatus Yanofskybacteria bacterium RIFCSPLOWO2_01_FULL_39_28]